MDDITGLHTEARTAYYRAGGVHEAELTSAEARVRRRAAWARAVRADTRTVLCAMRKGELTGVAVMGRSLGTDMDAGMDADVCAGLDAGVCAGVCAGLDAGMDADVCTGLDSTAVGRLYQIHVRPACWGQGVGGHLHTAFVRFLRAACLDTGLLEAWERNSRARGFYARHGWRPDGHRRPGPAGADYVRLRLTVSS